MGIPASLPRTAELAPATCQPLTFDERLTLAALRIDLACNDIMERHVEEMILRPQPTKADVLEQAAELIRTKGWIKNRLYDDLGYCLLGAVGEGGRAIGAGFTVTTDAVDLLYDVIKAEFDGDAVSIASFNDGEDNATRPLAALDRATRVARRTL